VDFFNRPDEVTVVGIATRHVCDFSEMLSAPVADAVPQAAQIILNLVKQFAYEKHIDISQCLR